MTAQAGDLLVEQIAPRLQGICFRARRTGNGRNADGRRGVRGYGYSTSP